MHLPVSATSNMLPGSAHDLQNALSTLWHVAHGYLQERLGSKPSVFCSIAYRSCLSSKDRYWKLRRFDYQRHSSLGLAKFIILKKLTPGFSWKT